jgi:hypothetical protein
VSTDVMDAVFARSDWLPDALMSNQSLVTIG